jgi:hypothetical protein
VRNWVTLSVDSWTSLTAPEEFAPQGKREDQSYGEEKGDLWGAPHLDSYTEALGSQASCTHPRAPSVAWSKVSPGVQDIMKRGQSHKDYHPLCLARGLIP